MDRDSQLRTQLYATYNQLVEQYNAIHAQAAASQIDPGQAQQHLAYLRDQIYTLQVVNPDTGTMWRINPESGAYEFKAAPSAPWEEYVARSDVASYWGHDDVVSANTQMLTSVASQSQERPQSRLRAVAGRAVSWFGGLSRLKKALVIAVVLMLVVNLVQGVARHSSRTCPSLSHTQIIDVTDPDMLSSINCVVALELIPSEAVGEVGVRFRPEIPVNFATLAVSVGNTLSVLTGSTPGDPVDEGVKVYQMGLVPSPSEENPELPILRSHMYVALAGVIASVEDVPAPVGAPAALEFLRRHGVVDSSDTHLTATVTRYELAVLLRNLYEQGFGVTADELSDSDAPPPTPSSPSTTTPGSTGEVPGIIVEE